MKRFIVVFAILMFGLPPTAQAYFPDATDNPEVVWPISRAPRDIGALDVVVVGVRHLYGARKEARYIDVRMPRLVFHTRNGIHCGDVIDSMCIKIIKGHYGKTGWAAMTIISPYKNPHYRIIKLNLDANRRMSQYVVGHELTHAVGLQHHKRYGIVGTGHPNYPTAVEIKALNKYYSTS